MNKKGFTVVELMTTFILVAIISTLLIKLFKFNGFNLSYHNMDITNKFQI